MKVARILGSGLFLLASGVLGLACASSDEVSSTSQQGGGTTTTDPGTGGAGGSATTTTTSAGGAGGSTATTDQACLLHNCSKDAECGACSDGRTICDVAEKRCVACDEKHACPKGKECAANGLCLDPNLTCPTDGKGNPTIQCKTSADCQACDPMHQVCDTAIGQCVACTAKDSSACQATDMCVNDKCTPKCPKACDHDDQCGFCGSKEKPAHACNAHKCSECSPTYACKAGFECDDHGVCIPICGIQGQVKGTCDVDADCVGCTGGNTKCHVPLNGGHGYCGPEAAGCSDLGNGVVVLPAPYDQYTNTCSDDADCNGVAIQYNVGKLLREQTGFDSIKDANVEYGMNVCADVKISEKISCGICVPCKVDADCGTIDIDKFALDAFGAIGSVAAAILLDQVFGPNDHKIHMFCQSVAAGYGVCAPCPGIVNDCSVGGGGGSGKCEHDENTEGTPLDPSCNPCAAKLCAVDSYCCTTEWDATCVSEVAQYCASIGHDECTPGDAMDPKYSACVSDVCDADAFCCDAANGEWDKVCVDEAKDICGISCN